MKNNINIVGNKQTFQYVIEYNRSNIGVSGNNFYWCKDTNNIKLYEDAIMYYRDKNDWYSIDKLNKDKEMLIQANGNLLLKVPQGREEVKEEVEEAPKDFDFRSVFENGKFKR